MTDSPQTRTSKKEIIARIAEPSRLLGMTPEDDTIQVKDPVTQDAVAV